MDQTDPLRPGHAGFCEVVVSVSHPGRVAGFAAAAGWTRRAGGTAPPELARLWGLTPHAVITDAVLGAPGATGGFLRFTHVAGVPQQPVRPLDAKPWDTGGLWLVYTRAADDDVAADALAAAGWPTVRGVHGFEFGELAVREVHHRGPDGLTLSVIEQQRPPLAVPATGLTPAFNAAMLVRDFDAARRFFVDVLGWRPWLEIDWDGDNPGLALLADPADFAGVRRVRTAIVHPTGENTGSVELIAFEGGPAGRDFAERARPPNTGALALRFAVPALDAVLARLAEHGVQPARRPATLDLAPWGRVRLAPVRAPDGAWLEFFEPVT
jgi:catechol 2,3-dioxygenase-like lactoylglutathione lyase family enzyme